MLSKKLTRLGVLAGTFVMLFAVSAQAYPVDTFTGPKVVTAISLQDPDPTLLKTDNVDIIGGQRDLLLDVSNVSGPAGPATYIGTIGEGSFVFNSGTPGVTATLQYDGDDTDIVGPPASLVNSEGLGGVDLTAAGTNSFKLDFLSIEGGDYQDTDVTIEVHNGTDKATFIGKIPDSSVPTRYEVLFSDFTGITSALASATSLEICLNPNGNPDVNFIMTGSVGVPEPATMILLALGGIAVLRRRNRA